MASSLLTLPNMVDIEITQYKTELIYKNHTIHIQKKSDSDISLTVDGEPLRYTPETPISIDNKNCFLLKKENDKYFIVSCTDYLEIRGDYSNDPAVNSIVKINLQKCLKRIITVSQLEQDEKQTGSSKLEGDSASQSTRGYADACQLYSIINSVSFEEKRKLEEAYQILLNLSHLSEKTLKYTVKLMNALLNGNNLIIEELSKSIEELSTSLANQLMQNKVLYLNYGLASSINAEGKIIEDGHHEVMKITSHGGDESASFNCIIYNAGYESQYTSNGRVKGVQEFTLPCNNLQDIQKFISLALQRKIRSNQGITQESFAIIDTEIQNYLSKIVRTNQKNMQLRGNCTTMSTRLCLEEAFGEDLFNKVYRFISNPENITHLLEEAAPKYKQEAIVLKEKVSETIRDKSIELLKSNKKINTNPLIQQSINLVDTDNIIGLVREAKHDIANANYNIGGGKQGSLLHYCIKNGAKKLAAECLNYMTGFEKDGSGYPALHFAILSGKNDIAKLIIDKNKHSPALNTPALDRTRALKLALDCDRYEIVDYLIKNGVNLSPEENDGHVIFNIFIEKSLIETDQEKYLALAIDKLSFSIAEHKLRRVPSLDPFIKDGEDECALDIIQGKLLSLSLNKEEPPKNFFSTIKELVNLLLKYDIEVRDGKYLFENPTAFSVLLKYVDIELFKSYIYLFAKKYKLSKDKDFHYYPLILPALLLNDFAKIDYLLLETNQPSLNNDVLLCIIATLESASDNMMPFTLEGITYILEKSLVEFDKKNMDKLAAALGRFVPEYQIELLISSHLQRHTKKIQNQNRPIYNTALKEIIDDFKNKENDFNQERITHFKLRQENYYAFGDMTRAVIKFVTGLNVTRTSASLQPKKTFASLIKSLFSKANKNDPLYKLEKYISPYKIIKHHHNGRAKDVLKALKEFGNDNNERVRLIDNQIKLLSGEKNLIAVSSMEEKEDSIVNKSNKFMIFKSIPKERTEKMKNVPKPNKLKDSGYYNALAEARKRLSISPKQ